MSKTWYYKLFGEEVGPVSHSSLLELLRDGHISKEDLVRQSTSEWKSVQCFEELSTGAEEPELATDLDLDLMLNSVGDSASKVRKPKGAAAFAQKASPPSEWYYRTLGQEFGPVTLDELQSLARIGTLHPGDEVKHLKHANWTPASRVRDLVFTIAKRETDSGFQDRTATLAPFGEAALKQEWYCEISGREYGPFSFQELSQSIAQGTLKLDQRARRGLRGSWSLVMDIPGLVSPEAKAQFLLTQKNDLPVEDDGFVLAKNAVIAPRRVDPVHASRPHVPSPPQAVSKVPAPSARTVDSQTRRSPEAVPAPQRTPVPPTRSIVSVATGGQPIAPTETRTPPQQSSSAPYRVDSGNTTPVTAQWNSARPTYPVALPRRKSSGETLESLLPFAKWGVAVLLLALGGFGVSKLVAGSRSQHQVETHAIQVKALLSGKPMPGASMTLTPILSPEQTAALDGDLSAGLQLVGRAVLGQDGVGTPGLSADQPGLPAGEYIASLNWCKVEVKDGETVAGPDLVPQIFRSPSTSTLRVHVAEGSNPLVTLQIVDPKVRARQMSYDHE